MWEDANYCWVVLCKNHWFHMRQSFLVRHRIPLAETDAVTPPPRLPQHFTVRCDECRKTYSYKPKDVMRSELEVPVSFTPHPLFREEPYETLDANRSTEQEKSKEEPPQKKEPPQDEPPEQGQTRAKGA